MLSLRVSDAVWILASDCQSQGFCLLHFMSILFKSYPLKQIKQILPKVSEYAHSFWIDLLLIVAKGSKQANLSCSPVFPSLKVMISGLGEAVCYRSVRSVGYGRSGI